jgi:hypothetical protein
MNDLKSMKFIFELRINLWMLVFSLLIQFVFGQKLKSLTEDTVLNHKCGFPVVLQAHASGNYDLYHKFYDYNLQQISLDSVYFSSSGHFKIHYTTDGPDSISSADRNGNGTADYFHFSRLANSTITR